MGRVLNGGPYIAEVDAIRDERLRAAAMGEEPDFRRIFAGKDISAGAIKVIEDIHNPIPPFEGNFINNVEYPEDYVLPGDGGKNIFVDADGAEQN